MMSKLGFLLVLMVLEAAKFQDLTLTGSSLLLGSSSKTSIKTAAYKEEYVILLIPNEYTKFEYDLNLGLKEAVKTTFFDVANKNEVFCLNSEKFIFVGSQFFYILSVDNPDINSPGIKYLDSLTSTITFSLNMITKTFIIASNYNSVGEMAQYDSSGTLLKKIVLNDLKDAIVDSITEDISPHKNLFLYTTSAGSAKYSLYDSSMTGLIAEGDLADLNLVPKDKAVVAYVKANLLKENIFVLCILKSKNMYCETAKITSNSIEPFAVEAEDGSTNFIALNNCNSKNYYSYILTLQAKYFGAVCANKSLQNNLLFSLVEVTSDKKLKFLVQNQNLVDNAKLYSSSFVFYKTKEIGLYYTKNTTTVFEQYYYHFQYLSDIFTCNPVSKDSFTVNSEPFTIDYSELLTFSDPFYSDISDKLAVTIIPDADYEIYLLAHTTTNPVKITKNNPQNFTLSTLDLSVMPPSLSGQFTFNFIIYSIFTSCQNTITFTVSPCHSSCITCDVEGNDDDTKCKKGCLADDNACHRDEKKKKFCKDGYYIFETTAGWEEKDEINCLDKTVKKDRFYADAKTEAFQPCDGRCLTCNTSGSNTESNCETCDKSNGYYPFDYRLSNCSEVPQEYFYLDASKQTIGKCKEGCKTCNDNSRCTSCDKDYPFFIQNTGDCLKQCSGTYNKKYLDTCVQTCPTGTKENQGECSLTKDDFFSKIDGKSVVDLAKKNLTFSLDDGKTKFEALQYEKEKGRTTSSYVDLGECENILKRENSIPREDPLYMIKVDVFRNDQLTSQIEYSIYSKEGKKLQLVVCENVTIEVSSPLNLQDNPTAKEMIDTAKFVSESGYNIFNSSDSFYTDICSPFVTEDNTDIRIEDRKKVYYKNVSFCEDNCELKAVDLESNRVNCSCDIKPALSLDESEFSFSTLDDQFKHVISNSNLRVIVCYKLVFDSSLLVKNIGSWIMLFIFLLEVVIIVLYSIFGIDPLLKVITFLLKRNDIESSENNVSNPPKRRGTHHKLKKKLKIQEEQDGNIKITIEPYENKEKNFQYSPRSKCSKKRFLSKDTEWFEKKDQDNGNDQTEHFETKEQIREGTIHFTNGHFNNKRSSTKVLTTGEKTTEESNVDFTDEELNKMNYKDSLVNDHRTFCRTYYSILKYNQLIIFTFINGNDYNLRLLKYSLFLISFGMFLTFNEFFYTDSSMSRNYEKKGKFDLIYSLPQTIFSSITSGVITFLLDFLSLSQDDIQKLKEEKDHEKAEKMSKTIIRCLKIKIGIFFSLIVMIMCFFWYYNTAFCAVFQKTQKNMILSTLTSFVLSMIYPFFFSLATTCFRIIALKRQNQCCFFVSRIVGLI